MKPDVKKILKECQWAIDKIDDYGFTTMISREFFEDVMELLRGKKQVHRKYDDKDVRK